MRNEIQLAMQDINDLINNRLRNKLGEYNIYGSRIDLPLTFETSPPIPIELKGIASDLVVAKIRLQNSEKPLLWDSAVKILDNYLERIYGFTRNIPFEPVRLHTITPRTGIIGSTVTLSGTDFEPSAKLDIVFNTTNPTTTPAEVITSDIGAFTGVTFTIPANQPDGSYVIKVSDKFGGIKVNYQVTS
ncbi:hypothetical protein LCGC14_1396570 [marine sediment metagenome]|uniref:IPT/TIG domain-containing protein n=1 Tax=marine sediment metagenome TaxID=412755 RepID=A0A0F9MZZ4_9ZZZZ